MKIKKSWSKIWLTSDLYAAGIGVSNMIVFFFSCYVKLSFHRAFPAAHLSRVHGLSFIARWWLRVVSFSDWIFQSRPIKSSFHQT